jgi:hypothetical protein
MDTIASNDRRRPHEQIQRIRELRPDMILVSGGVDGGTTTHVVQIAELIAPAKPQPSQPQWIVAGEIVETSQLFARTVAGIDPQWIYQLAPHCCK